MKNSLVILILIVFILCFYILFGFQEKEYTENTIPGGTYRCRESIITKINYCEYEGDCSAVVCESKSSFEIHGRSYFDRYN